MVTRGAGAVSFDGDTFDGSHSDTERLAAVLLQLFLGETDLRHADTSEQMTGQRRQVRDVVHS